MARTDTLGHFLTDIANAIRTKKGTSDTIIASNFDTEIENLPSGGNAEIKEKDINFFDYDGTLTNSYTKAEFLLLTEMPSNPSHEGLIAEGWNWSLQDAKTYLQTHDCLDIGQTYVTNDNSTRIYITLNEGRLSPTLGIGLNGTATVDWGDNTTDTVTSGYAGNVTNVDHTYSQAGDYVIKISTEGSLKFFGSSRYGSHILWKKATSNYSQNYVYTTCIKKIEFGNNISFGTYGGFWNCRNLETVSIPKGVTNIDTYLFNGCSSLKHINLPNTVTTLSQYCFGGCNSLKHICLPNTITTIQQYSFQTNSGLKRFIMPDTVTSVGQYSLSSCNALEKVVFSNSLTSLGNYVCQSDSSLKEVALPNGLTSIPNNAFGYITSLAKINLPSTITSIGSNVFTQCYGIKSYDFSNFSSIPTLSSSNSFDSQADDMQIIVPDDLYENWIIANQWSNLASKIVKASEI